MIPMTLHDMAVAMGGRMLRSSSAQAVVTGVSSDSRTLRAGEVLFAIRGGNFDGHDFLPQACAAGAAACVADARGAAALGADFGVPLIVVDDTVAALGRLARHHRRSASARVIAVTGSNGKTTTKGMIAHALAAWKPTCAAQRSFNNQIGVPLTLLACTADDAFLVVEIGTNAPGEVAALAALAEPDIGVLTGIGDAHLAGLGGREGVAREKYSLFDQLRPGGWAFIESVAARRVSGWPRRPELDWIVYGCDGDADVRLGGITTDIRQTEATIAGRWPLRLSAGGAHNALNATGAFAVCTRLGMEPAEVLAALATFRLPEMRMHVRELGGFTVVEDCYNANPTSMAAAIDLLAATRGCRRVLVVGEMAELGADAEALHRAAGQRAAAAGVDVIVSIGTQARCVSEAAAGASSTVRTRHFADAAAAAEGLRGMLGTGDTVLIKGSRAARLERLVQQWQSAVAAPAGRQDLAAAVH